MAAKPAAAAAAADATAKPTSVAQPTSVPTVGGSAGSKPTPTVGGDSAGKKTVRIYCFGDSLTEGWYNRGFGSAPYADTTQKQLDALIAPAPAAASTATAAAETGAAAAAATTASAAAPAPAAAPAAAPAWASGVSAFVVDCNGKPGDRVCTMSKRLARGLRAAADAKAPYDVVAILAGTNDLFYPESEQLMMHALQELHGLCHAYGARTIAMTLPEIASYDDDDGTELDHATATPPPSSVAEGKQLNEEAKRKAYNALVTAYAAQHPERVTLLDLNARIPYFAMSVSDRKLYWDDGLHFAPAGYARIGALVADTVVAMLAAKL